jgi:hypothetical protein
MPLPYVISANIDRGTAEELINKLAYDDEFRRRFQESPQQAQQILHDYGIEVTPQSLPDPIRLPEGEDIDAFLDVFRGRVLREGASPFALVALILAFAAMPVMMGDRPSRDGAG